MSPKQHAASLLKWVRTISEGIVNDIPESSMTKQACPTDNHPLWVLGHIASTDVWIAGMLGISGVAVPESWNGLFGGGSKPKADAKAYPKVAEVRKVFDANRAAVLKWLEAAPDSALTVSLKEKSSGFANDPIDAMFKLAWHEGWHFGQAASVRKALGLKPVMG